jgi:hypothetical protein
MAVPVGENHADTGTARLYLLVLNQNSVGDPSRGGDRDRIGTAKERGTPPETARKPFSLESVDFSDFFEGHVRFGALREAFQRFTKH